jgi:hypothetical protein
VAATFQVEDEVTVLRKEDRNGGGHGVVRKVTGTGADTRYTVQYTGRHKSTKPVIVSGDQLQSCPVLGKRIRGPAATAHGDGNPRYPPPKPWRSRSANTPSRGTKLVAKTPQAAKAPSAGTKRAATVHLIILFTWS